MRWPCFEVNPAKREEYVQRLMEPPNATWNQIMAQARTMGSECLKSQEVIKNIANILKTNTACCTSLGQPFQNQMSGRRLHSSTSQLNVSAFCGIGGASRGCLGGV